MKARKAALGLGRFLLLAYFVALFGPSACTIDITMPDRAPTYWCYSDSLKAARDSFPLCPPDSAKVAP